MKVVGAVVVATVALVASAGAEPRKVLVMPLDGNAPPMQKAQLDASVAKLVKARLDGDVTIADATFGETATAVGCDPRAPECAESVRATLGVDELVYGSATTENGSTTITLRRARADAPIAEQTSVIAETDSGDMAEPALAPVFADAPVALEGAVPDPAAPSDASVRKNFFDTRERKLGTAFAAGSAIVLTIGLSYWAAKSDLQEQIDDHPRTTLDDLRALVALEDRAAGKALRGNLLVALGLGLGGAAVYYFYTDHQNRRATISPAPVEGGTGMGVVVTGRW